MNDELNALVVGVLADLDGFGALADWLQEHDREYEAKLLRARGRTWKRERHAAAERTRAKEREIAAPMLDAVASLRAAGFTCEASIHVKVGEDTAAMKRHDESFRSYLRARFGADVHDVRRWFRHAGIDHAVPVAEPVRGYIRACCGMLVPANAINTFFGKRICVGCRAAVPKFFKKAERAT